MKNFDLNFGLQLTKDQMKKIGGGDDNYCTVCDGGEANIYYCPYDEYDCGAMFAGYLQDGQFDGYSCNFGASGGIMDACPW